MWEVENVSFLMIVWFKCIFIEQLSQISKANIPLHYLWGLRKLKLQNWEFWMFFNPNCKNKFTLNWGYTCVSMLILKASIIKSLKGPWMSNH